MSSWPARAKGRSVAAAEFRCRDHLPLLHTCAAIVVRVGREDTYRIHVVPDEAAACQTLMGELDGRRAAVVTDRTVRTLHCEKLTAVLEEHSRLLGCTLVDPGEAGKSLQTAYRLIDWLAQIGLARRDVLVAVGGGALLDTVGWVASAYMRGVPYVNVPTTLLAQVDAGIGGKVGVDHASAKNLVGAFYQPRAVISCLTYLNTLDTRHLRSGLAEVVKKAVIASPELFAFLTDNAVDLVAGQGQALDTLVRSASAIKCELVSRDPYERDLRRPLNFGHTIGHAVETVTGYGPVLHGEAVAFGMAAAVRIARARTMIAAETAGQVIGLLTTLNLPVHLDELPAVPETSAVLAALDKIRQIRDGGLRFVLPIELGETVIADDVTDEEILSAISVASHSDIANHSGSRPAAGGPAGGGAECSAGR